MRSGVRIRDGGGVGAGAGWTGALAMTPRLRALTAAAPLRYIPATYVTHALLLATAHGTTATLSATHSSPFSSSCSRTRPTGVTFQSALVGRPGGVAVRVCQGASVQARRLGRGRVGSSLFTPLQRAMAHMAPTAACPMVPCAMVEWDGAGGREASVDRAIDAVGAPVTAVLSLPLRPLCPAPSSTHAL